MQEKDNVIGFWKNLLEQISPNEKYDGRPLLISDGKIKRELFGMRFLKKNYKDIAFLGYIEFPCGEFSGLLFAQMENKSYYVTGIITEEEGIKFVTRTIFYSLPFLFNGKVMTIGTRMFL